MEPTAAQHPTPDDGHPANTKRFVVPPPSSSTTRHTVSGDATDTAIVALDSDIVGLAESYLKAGHLTDPERDALHARRLAAEELARELSEPARTYAQRLASLARSILEATAEP